MIQLENLHPDSVRSTGSVRIRARPTDKENFAELRISPRDAKRKEAHDVLEKTDPKSLKASDIILRKSMCISTKESSSSASACRQAARAGTAG